MEQLRIDYAVPFQHLQMLKSTLHDRTDPDLSLQHSKQNPKEIRWVRGRLWSGYSQVLFVRIESRTERC